MSTQVFCVFNGANGTSGPVPIAVSGPLAGDKVSQVLVLAPFADVGDQTGGFDPVIPANGTIIQNSGGQNWSTWTFLAVLSRD